MRKVIFIFLIFFAFPKCSSAWEGIVVHHSASEKMSLDDCNRWHNERGWDGCGYNYLIQKDGTLEEARGEKQGAHARGRNRTHLGVCLIGYETFTEEQIKTLRWFIDSRGLEFENHHEQCPTKNWGQFRMAVEMANVSRNGEFQKRIQQSSANNKGE